MIKMKYKNYIEGVEPFENEKLKKIMEHIRKDLELSDAEIITHPTSNPDQKYYGLRTHDLDKKYGFFARNLQANGYSEEQLEESLIHFVRSLRERKNEKIEKEFIKKKLGVNDELLDIVSNYRSYCNKNVKILFTGADKKEVIVKTDSRNLFRDRIEPDKSKDLYRTQIAEDSRYCKRRTEEADIYGEFEGGDFEGEPILDEENRKEIQFFDEDIEKIKKEFF